MLVETAVALLSGVATHVLGDQTSEAVRRRSNGTVTIPLSTLEKAIETHAALMSEALATVRALNEAISILQAHHQIVVVEAPILAVQIPGRLLNTPTGGASGTTEAAAPPASRPTSDQPSLPPQATEFQRRMQEAYPTTDLEFD